MISLVYRSTRYGLTPILGPDPRLEGDALVQQIDDYRHRAVEVIALGEAVYSKDGCISRSSWSFRGAE